MKLAVDRYVSEIIPAPRNDATDVRIVVFPYAGGSAAVYSGWRTIWPDRWQLLGVTLPGRAHRLTEPFDHDPASTVRKIADELVLREPATTTIFVGHSMGADIAFAVGQLVTPHALVCLARAPLPLARSSAAPHEVEVETRAELRARLGTLEIADAGVVDELVEMNMPVLAADLALLAEFPRNPPPLPVPIVALYGENDDVEPLSWDRRSSQHTVLEMVLGDHFFAMSDASPVLRVIHNLVDERERMTK